MGNNLQLVRHLGRDGEGRIIEADRGIQSAAATWESEVAFEQATTGAADGDSILTISLPAYKSFICTSATFDCDNSIYLRVGTGDLGSMTDYWGIHIPAGGIEALSDGESPLFVINNDTSSSVTIRLYAPQTLHGAATNNNATKYVAAYLGGRVVGSENRSS